MVLFRNFQVTSRFLALLGQLLIITIGLLILKNQLARMIYLAHFGCHFQSVGIMTSLLVSWSHVRRDQTVDLMLRTK